MPVRICVAIGESTTEKARAAMKKASQWADLVEIRADYIDDPDIRGLLCDKPCPVLFTMRVSSEGGRFTGPECNRLDSLVEASRSGADWIDMEYSSHWQDLLGRVPRDKIVLSSHHFSETPESLELLFEKMAAAGAGVIKIATRARSLADNVRIARLLRHASARNIPLCALAMGRRGIPSRVLGPHWGSWMTFASLPGSEGTADGQVTADELVTQYRIRSIGPGTEIYGVLGNPLGHSLSPQIHNAAFAARERDAVFIPLEAESVEDFLTFDSWSPVQGASVTIPYKSALCFRATSLSVETRRIGAANTLIKEPGGWHAENTDVDGFLEPLLARTPVRGKRVVVLGAGGAARAVVCGLCSQGAAVCIIARDPVKARDLADAFGASSSSWNHLWNTSWDLLVNTTPVGMHPDSGQSPIPKEWLSGEWVYDLVYNPPETQLLKDAAQRGCKTITGTEMFLAQASRQQYLWCGTPPPAKVMHQALQTALQRIFSKAE